MGLLRPIGMGQGYVKAGFHGFQGSGKTYTATDLAIGIRAHFGLKGPIVFFDTEGGAEFVVNKIKKATGLADVPGMRSRAMTDLLGVVEESEDMGASVLIVDSITHVWQEVQDAHLKAVNERLASKKMAQRWTMEFQDWAPVKKQWARWTTAFLNSKLHIIFCGRAGHTYDHEKNEETGRKELIKTGTKLKAENEFGYEPSLLIEMERVEKARGKKQYEYHATILKDRWDVINGSRFVNPTFKNFLPHVALYRPGAHAPIDTSIKTEALVDEDGRDERKLDRAIFLEKIEAELVRAFPSTSAAHKSAKADLLELAFQTRSWTEITTRRSLDDLKAGLERIKNKIADVREGFVESEVEHA